MAFKVNNEEHSFVIYPICRQELTPFVEPLKSEDFEREHIQLGGDFVEEEENLSTAEGIFLIKFAIDQYAKHQASQQGKDEDQSDFNNCPIFATIKNNLENILRD